MKDRLLTLQEVADYLRITKGWAAHIWASWIKEGVNPIRIGGRKALRFKESEILRMVDNWAVMK